MCDGAFQNSWDRGKPFVRWNLLAKVAALNWRALKRQARQHGAPPARRPSCEEEGTVARHRRCGRAPAAPGKAWAALLLPPEEPRLARLDLYRLHGQPSAPRAPAQRRDPRRRAADAQAPAVGDGRLRARLQQQGGRAPVRVGLAAPHCTPPAPTADTHARGREARPVQTRVCVPRAHRSRSKCATRSATSR